MRHRHGVLFLLILLFAITYIDRVCISVAGPRMQEELGISPIGWSWVTTMFMLSYCIFEIPTGALGDRIGPRRVLARIVVWWSIFTALTGMVSNYFILLVVRFCFGAGEAGAFPNASIVISRWFPMSQRAQHRGRDPDGQPDRRCDRAVVDRANPDSLWLARRVLSVRCRRYGSSSTKHRIRTFLVRGRGFSEGNLMLSALPYVIAVCTNLAGGAISDALVRRFGRKWGRRSLGTVALGAAAAFTLAAMATEDQLLTVVWLSLVYGAITFQQSGVFGACLDISGKHAGSVVGMMNTSAQVGGLISTFSYGYIVDRFQSYDAPFVPMAAVLLLGAIFWLRIDASQELEASSI